MTTPNRTSQTQKLTATMLIAMAQRQGITLVEAGTPAAPAGDQSATIATLKAEVGRLTYILNDNAGFVGEERDAMVARIATLTKERDEACNALVSLKGWSGAKALADCQGELAEARAEVASLTRTVEKLRRTALQTSAAPQAVPETRGDRDGDQVATVTGIIRFHGPQGVGTADRIKAIGGRWQWNPKRADGSRSQTGYWKMPDSPETAELIAALRFEGKQFSEE